MKFRLLSTLASSVLMPLFFVVLSSRADVVDDVDDESMYKNELIEPNDGWTIHNDYTTPLPKSYIPKEELPANFNWGNVDGKSYLTHSLNQHIPQ